MSKLSIFFLAPLIALQACSGLKLTTVPSLALFDSAPAHFAPGRLSRGAPGELTSVNIAKLRFTQDNISANFSQGHVDVFLPYLAEEPFNQLNHWYSEGVQRFETVASGNKHPAAKQRGMMRGGAQATTKKQEPVKRKVTEVNPILVVKKVITNSDYIEGDMYGNKYLVTVEVKSLALDTSSKRTNRAVTLPWPLRNKQKVLLQKPAPGMELRITHVNPQKRHVAFQDEILLVQDAKQILRSIRSGAGKRDLSLAETLESKPWREAARQAKVPHFDTLRVVFDERRGTYYSLDNRRLHCLKEVFEYDYLKNGMPLPANQNLLVNVFRLSDLQSGEKRAQSKELRNVAKQFFGGKSKVHGYTWGEQKPRPVSRSGSPAGSEASWETGSASSGASAGSSDEDFDETAGCLVVPRQDSHFHSAGARAHFLAELRHEGVGEAFLGAVLAGRDATSKGATMAKADAGKLCRVRTNDLRVCKRMQVRADAVRKEFAFNAKKWSDACVAKSGAAEYFDADNQTGVRMPAVTLRQPKAVRSPRRDIRSPRAAPVDHDALRAMISGEGVADSWDASPDGADAVPDAWDA